MVPDRPAVYDARAVHARQNGSAERQERQQASAAGTAASGKVPMFINGKIAMGTFGDWSMTDVFKQASPNLEWDIAPIPYKAG